MARGLDAGGKALQRVVRGQHQAKGELIDDLLDLSRDWAPAGSTQESNVRIARPRTWSQTRRVTSADRRRACGNRFMPPVRGRSQAVRHRCCVVNMIANAIQVQRQGGRSPERG